jgi:ADP-dependent NAD(P)H-hydrate dehydratase
MSEPTVVTSALLRAWALPQVGEDSDKNSRGTVVVVGGALDTPGAVLLAGLAALRVGAGKLTLATVAANASAVAVAAPEAAVVPLPAEEDGSLGPRAAESVADLVDGTDAVLVGPGMRGPDASRQLTAAVLDQVGAKTTLVLDAMGLTCGALAGRPARDGQLIATPNVAEAARLLETDADALEADAATALRLAESIDAVVALRSHVAAPDGRVWVDGSGNSGLGTSGSGDVLAGAVAGLAARGTSAAQAAVWAAHLHAAAGERLAARVGRLGYLARELLDELPRVLGELDA